MRPLDPRLLRRTHAARALLGADVALGLATALAVLVQATLLARVVARSFHGGSLHEVRLDLVLLGAVFLLRGVLAWGFELAGRVGAIGALSQLRLEVLERRLRHEPAALDGVESAELTGAAVHGLGPLEAYFGRFLPQLVLAFVVPLAVLAWVAPLDPAAAVVMVLTLPLVPVFMVLIGRYTEQRTRARWHALALLSTHFLDVVRGLPTLRAYNRSRAQAESIAAVSERYRTTTMRTLRVSFLSGAVLELAATLGIALAAVTVGIQLVNGDVGLQAGLTVLVLAPELYLPFRNVAAQYHASADGVAVAERLLDVLDAPAPPPADGGSRLPVSHPVPVLRMDEVSFSFPSRPVPVLEGVELELWPDETVVLVGPSGAGKSTLASLVLGLARPRKGRVLVDGRELDEESLAAWRRSVAWVPQRATLFSGTVADNVRLGEPAADDERVASAARLAGADEFIADLPDGYATVVGDGGRPLSAGESQRLALARAFLRSARLVVLDEPSANLDPSSARAIEAAVARLAAGRTTLVIAHRPGLVELADRVVRLEGGRLREERRAPRSRTFSPSLGTA